MSEAEIPEPTHKYNLEILWNHIQVEAITFSLLDRRMIEELIRRAYHAERRVAELEAALRDIRATLQRGDLGGMEMGDAIESIVDEALVATPEESACDS